jgi:3-isopropylmalate/(R)-2-methylmalate dehydratase small subunit
MKDSIRGPVYVVGDDIDTDQIIPAQYLNLNPAIPEERKMFAQYALSGLPDGGAGLPEGNHPLFQEEAPPFRIILAGKNFGCGSSREHAPISLEAAGVEAVVAEFYARIFYRNCVNGGYLLPFECEERLIDHFRTGDEAEIRVGEGEIINLRSDKNFRLKPLGEVLPILEAGDVFAYAKASGMLPPSQ